MCCRVLLARAGIHKLEAALLCPEVQGAQSGPGAVKNLLDHLDAMPITDASLYAVRERGQAMRGFTCCRCVCSLFCTWLKLEGQPADLKARRCS
jgi:hypothetical protein